MKTRADIAVVGSGAAGVAAAVSAARAGRSTVLLDQRPAAGGIGGFSGLTTLCGLYDEAGKILNDGFAREFADALAEAPPVHMGRTWVLPYRPERFREVVSRLLSTTPGLEACFSTPLVEVTVSDNRIVQLNELEVGAVIDCSGTAEVARAAGAECLATDPTTQSPAIVFPLRGVTRPLDTPADVAQVLLPLARAKLPTLLFQPSLEPGTVTVKFSGTAEQVKTTLEFLKQNMRGFENSFTPVREFSAAQRAGRMIIGRYLLTGADVLAGRKFADPAGSCAWPIEQWGADGTVRLRYLAAGEHYHIPARSLRAARLENLFMAGKTISADVDAIGSARVMGACLATGAAAGNLAARWLNSPDNP